MKLPWKRDSESPGDDAGAAAPPGREKLLKVCIGASRNLLALLRGAVQNFSGDATAEARETAILDGLESSFAGLDRGDDVDPARLEGRLRKDFRELESFISRQRSSAQNRERELSEVVSLLSRSVAAATRDNASFYRNVRAQGEKLAEASHTDDLQKLKSVLQVAASKLQSLVDHKESADQSRIDSLSGQVTELKAELQAVRREAETDPLTGILNRRSFDVSIAELVNSYSGTRRSFALLFFDIDDFKVINDRYGHQVGDRVLIAFTQRCRSLLRPEDSLARYGGEEFVAILDGVSLRQAVKRASSICEAVAGARYSIEKGENSRSLAMTVSAGVSVFHRHDTVAEVVQRADQALYLAKSQGKNRALSEKDLED